MNKLKKISKLSITAISIIIIVGIVFYYEEIKETEEEIKTTKIVTAKKYIPENTVITKDMIYLDNRYLKDVEKEKQNIAFKLEDIIGKRTLVPMFENEAVKLSRLIKNKEYMNDNKDKKLITFELANDDKALDIKRGDYIDIWLEPKKDEESKLQARLLFEKLLVVEVDNAEFANIKDTDSQEKLIPTYITISLKNQDIDLILNSDKENYTIRTTLYSKNNFYSVINNVISKGVCND